MSFIGLEFACMHAVCTDCVVMRRGAITQPQTNLCAPDLVRPDAPALGGDDDVGELLGGEEAAEESQQVALLGAPITNDVRKDFSYLTPLASSLLCIFQVIFPPLWTCNVSLPWWLFHLRQ